MFYLFTTCGKWQNIGEWVVDKLNDVLVILGHHTHNPHLRLTKNLYTHTVTVAATHSSRLLFLRSYTHTKPNPYFGYYT